MNKSFQLASLHGLTGSVSRITPKKVASDSHKLESGQKKKKELSFPPLIHTQTTQELVIFEKIAYKTRLIYDEEEKKRRQPLHHKQRAIQRRQSQASVAHQDDSNFITRFIWAMKKTTKKKKTVRMSQVCQLWSKILMMKETRRESGGGCGSLTPAAGCQTLMPRDRSSTPGY